MVQWAIFSAIVALGGALLGLLALHLRKLEGREAPGASLEPRLAFVESRIESLLGAMKEEADRAERASERSRYHARKSEESRQEREEEYFTGDDVRPDDALGGAPQGVLPLRAGMENGAQGADDVHIPDPWTLAGLS